MKQVTGYHIRNFFFLIYPSSKEKSTKKKNKTCAIKKKGKGEGEKRLMSKGDVVAILEL